MNYVNDFANWYVDLSPGAAAIIAFLILIVLSIIAIWGIDYVDPLKVEQRAIRRKRKQRRGALRILNRADYSTERGAFRDAKGTNR